jgi:beta-lactamase regulating signal transducer with metallopeptidase domain
MSELPVAFGLLAAQIAAVGAIALLLEACTARRCPATAARLLILAVVTVPLLTLAMFCPLPVMWTVNASSEPTAPQASRAAGVDEIAAEPAAQPRGFDVASLLRLLPRVERTESPRLGQALAVLWSVAVAVAALRLGGGLWSVNRLRRRSTVGADGDVYELLSLLRNEMGVARAVELREDASPGLPATAGWLRPVILLPTSWRDWSAAELRAALAHELAHIRSNDYLTGIIAKLLTLPHGYHPLSWRLMSRLRLRQEIAADALGAPHAGGRREYVRALARLALREPAGPGVPAPLMLSAHGGDLFRRIQMLRNMEEARPLSRALRGLTLAVLIVSTLTVAALRGPAREPTPAPPAAQNEPFDLSYISGDTHAIACVRPAALLAQPGMGDYAKLMRAELVKALTAKGHQMPDGLTLSDIDQIVADVQLQVALSGQKGQRSLSMGSGHFMIRMKNDVDWLKTLKALFGDVEIKTQDAHTIYRVKAAGFWPGPIPLFAIDARTLVMVREEKDTFVIPAKSAKTFADRLGPTWKQVERSAFAMAYDNGDGYWTKHLEPEVKDVTGTADMLKNAKSLCLGLAVDGGIDADLFVGVNDAAAAKAEIDALGRLFTFAAGQDATEKDAESAAGSKLFTDFVASGKIEGVGNAVHASGHSSVKLVDLITSMNAEAKTEKK